jgi:hypothetical protein
MKLAHIARSAVLLLVGVFPSAQAQVLNYADGGVSSRLAGLSFGLPNNALASGLGALPGGGLLGGLPGIGGVGGQKMCIVNYGVISQGNVKGSIRNEVTVRNTNVRC